MNNRPDPGYSQQDLDEVSDNPEITAEELAQASRGTEGLPIELARAIEVHARRQLEANKPLAKQLLSIRVDRDVLEAYKATGPGWQGRMNAALRKGIEAA